MDEQMMNALRQDPPTTLSVGLRTRLRGVADDSGGTLASRPGTPPAWRRWAAWATAAAAMLMVLVLPGVRASAESFLSLFRVSTFVPVTVDPSRADALRASQADVTALLGTMQVLEDPGPPTEALSLGQAAALAGTTVKEPATLPDGAARVGLQVRGAWHARATGDTAKLQQVLDALAIDSPRAPTALDGQQVDVRVPPIVLMEYQRNATSRARFLQARAPEVALPAGVNMATLGEIGLRILGLSRADAHQFAASVDWSSSLLVPVPPTARSVKQVEIGDARGLLVEATGPEGRPVRVLLWSDAGTVYAIEGSWSAADIQLMAHSLR